MAIPDSFAIFKNKQSIKGYPANLHKFKMVALSGKRSCSCELSEIMLSVSRRIEVVNIDNQERTNFHQETLIIEYNLICLKPKHVAKIVSLHIDPTEVSSNLWPYRF